jgi:hypothetical protein
MTTNCFDYAKYQLAIKIYFYAECLVTTPNDDQRIGYARSEAAAAMAQCRENLIYWSPVATPCKGKKLAGRVKVEVTTYHDTAYGFSHYAPVAKRIFDILLEMWNRNYRNEEIQSILEVK